jgi:thiol-disulfide isomerase/thioredoxin
LTTEPPPATAFITTNTAPPEGAIVDAKGIARDAAGRPYGYSLLGEAFPALELPLYGGGQFSSADLIGKWTVVDIWGVWCPDCVADGVYVAALATAIDQDPSLNFISIHTPPSASRIADSFGKFGSLDAYFAAKGFSYPTAIDADASTLEPLKVSWRPSYLVVGPDGRVRGYRSDFSAAKGEPVKDFLRDIAELKKQG